MTHPFMLLVGGDPSRRTGGYGYDRRMTAELQALGQPVALQGLAGRFPDGDQQAKASLEGTLRSVPDGELVVIDGLALGGMPEVIEAHAERLRLIALIHHPLGDETGLDAATRERLDAGERRSLAAVHGVVTTSAFTAGRLEAKGITGASVVTPGTDAAPLTEARRAPPWRLLCVASVIPRKDHASLVEALAGLTDYDWRCICAGSLEADPACAGTLRAGIRDAGIEDRVELTGELGDDALNERYAAADLFVLPTRYEGYGMALTEAVARGIPVIVGDGGAVREAVPAEAARFVEPGDVTGLSQALAAFMGDADERAELRAGARAARERLPDWRGQARRLKQVIDAFRDA